MAGAERCANCQCCSLFGDRCELHGGGYNVGLVVPAVDKSKTPKK